MQLKQEIEKNGFDEDLLEESDIISMARANKVLRGSNFFIEQDIFSVDSKDTYGLALGQIDKRVQKSSTKRLLYKLR